MSYPSFEIVKEFFNINNFLVLERGEILFAKNLREREEEIEKFIIEKDDIQKIKECLIKPISWHTQKFTPSVLNKFPEIFQFPKNNFLKDKNCKKILIIPDLPSTQNLRNKSIEIMQNKNIDNVILFPTIISSLIEKINPRKVYLSFTNEILRILKFYNFFSENRELPFNKK